MTTLRDIEKLKLKLENSQAEYAKAEEYLQSLGIVDDESYGAYVAKLDKDIEELDAQMREQEEALDALVVQVNQVL